MPTFLDNGQEIGMRMPLGGRGESYEGQNLIYIFRPLWCFINNLPNVYCAPRVL